MIANQILVLHWIQVLYAVHKIFPLEIHAVNG